MSFVEGRLTRVGNFNTEQLLQFVGSFKAVWYDELQSFVAGKRKDALDSVAANRNSIAHGGSVGLTYSRIREYYGSVCEVVDFVDGMFR